VPNLGQLAPTTPVRRRRRQNWIPAIGSVPVPGPATVRVEWAYPPTTGPKAPTGFHVYLGTGSVNYTSPAATVLFTTGIANTFGVNVTGLPDATTYLIGVRAYNSTAEEPNTYTVSVLTDATGPGPVDSLTGIAV